MDLEPIYETAKNGKKKVWNIQVLETPEGYGKIVTTFGYVDGKQQVQENIITKGKNIGKKNETSPYIQACNEAQSLWKKKREKVNQVLPMLAHEYNKHKDKIKFPCFVQPKLDGVRMLAHCKDNTITFLSRTGKPLYGLDHIRDELLKFELMKENEVWDGELYSSSMSFDEISGYCRTQKQKEQSQKPEFWVFDASGSCEKKPFAQRVPRFEAYYQLKYVREVGYDVVNSEKEAEINLNNYIKEGYEGMMLRNKEGHYEYNYRSYNLQKWKLFMDSEFEVVDVIEGKGIDKGTGIFICKTENDVSFQVRCEGSHEERAQQLNQKQSLIGKLLTVKYQELTKTGVPRFPVGKCIRET